VLDAFICQKLERLDRMESRFETRFDRLEAKVDGLEVFTGDAKRRLTRIESYLQLSWCRGASRCRA
jgi:hypothetical protein